MNKRSIRIDKKKFIRWAIGVVSVLAVTMLILIFTKKISINRWFVGQYEMMGVDVSNYQGEIDWKKLESQDVDFAYIKATEGSSFVDRHFVDNWDRIAETEIYAGAYHFFSFESPGIMQADHYIETVGSLEGKMLPAVDVEYYGNWSRDNVNVDVICKELQELLVRLEEEYGKKPVIYCTYKAYYDFIQDRFEEYDLWIRNVYVTPDVNLAGKWKYWQYTDTAKMEGYSGTEPYIDQNVFAGDREEFLTFNKIKE